ncbi:putative kinase-like protein TMKL1 [Ipomoea triloba]|uniref:putative kinase-like protein TMKL1 n=1 Tax=Ipomoea triloba TaxID=35885 RepID=UPI00125CDA28|nr:putative kinase-like protein TMKL1 [Ipomoea triloba]
MIDDELLNSLSSQKLIDSGKVAFDNLLAVPSANLSGTVPREIGELVALQSLYLGVNALSVTIPLELGYISSLSNVELSGNMFTGPVPVSIWNLCENLVSLRLHGNSLSGHNSFSGDFSEFVARFSGLKELNLGDNKLSSTIPGSLSALHLEKLNISYYSFSGVLPNFGQPKFGVEAFEGNGPELCGLPLRPCNGNSGLSPGAIAGIVIGLMAGAVLLASLLIGYFSGKKRRTNDNETGEEDFEELEDEENGGGWWW